MENLKQFFSYLNDIDFPYVVLRNFENLPHAVEFGNHSDLDLLVYDYDHFKETIPQAKEEFEYPRVRHRLPIGDTHIFLDVRHIGDDYYPEDFEKDILKEREFNPNGFWTPNPSHFRIALAYHVVHHKNFNNYPKWLGDISIEDLLEALKVSRVGWVPPLDHTVGKFNAYWKGATSIVSRENGLIVKKQVSFKGYDLISNEKRILESIKSDHFPKVLGYIKDDHSLILEDCGEVLSLNNLPDDWDDQLQEIVSDLGINLVQHRDIRPENLMVINGVIKLIDFGWAKFNEDDIDSPPECLGYPYKPSYGFDDSFSMKKIIKKFEYELEAKNENSSN